MCPRVTRQAGLDPRRVCTDDKSSCAGDGRGPCSGQRSGRRTYNDSNSNKNNNNNDINKH